MTEVIWHELECGSYAEDLPLWRALADEVGDPILEVGAGAGRVTLELALCGHDVTALDVDGELLAALEQRCAGLGVQTARADARTFELDREFALCLVPMQTIQLLGSAAGRAQFLRRARSQLRAGGILAAAIADRMEPFEVGPGLPAPLPDMCEIEGVVYSSTPVAVREDGDGFVLERRRETVAADGTRSCSENSVRLDRLDPSELEHEAIGIGLDPLERRRIDPTDEYVGSEVVVLRA
jgi:SAM-dependent methyltransferase